MLVVFGMWSGMGCNNNDDWVIILRNERRVSSSEVHDKCYSPALVSLVVTIQLWTRGAKGEDINK